MGNDVISSVRLRKPDIVLYEHAGYKGQTLPLTEATPNFIPLGFNDKASSIEVTSGKWTVYQDVNYKGKSLILGVGKYDIDYITKNLGNDVISSARPAEISLFEHANYDGKRMQLSKDTPTLVPLGFNDIVSSIEVIFGDWTVYEHVDYKGKSLDLKVGKYDIDYIKTNLGNDVISSVRLTP
ncbi:epidermal differentiation-specific protein-like [Halichondria panicea]|uniref:epidermal differentiation-specific protein-like n=1 Tax=Halichondria panicea TaxID=6063 RepID=UPI00312B55E8